MKETPYLVEACVETLKQSITAEKNGADRIELCADLHLGGVTPTKELVRKVKKELQIPIRIMIRPRGGDFQYSAAELTQMRESIEFCKEIGVDGVVFGFLQDDKRIDLSVLIELAKIAKPLQVIFHKAIDETPNILESVTILKETGLVDGILSSGGCATALEGASALREMLKRTGEELEIICAGKITTANLQEIHQKIGSGAYHGRRIVPGLK
ncbi:copper homeostasis protein [Salegentibacter echinorum]|uniref:PF03932 family protein CutC n=1 Tax=Salegentibacter echinorum TaxID=1073325 RepID=A0A1M5I8A7_SALEC|nr:copper homeostasis protein CutC [Salegentibacter echinorum]SHG24506.1 copper homeostasis protein [Salegentibacter echinorum]